MEFTDRVSAYPNRYMLTDESGNSYYVILERADDPVVIGTPLNAETFNAMLAGLSPATESEDYPGCYYRTVNSEVEWINPPMELDIEYRTTERHMGKAVYTKVISLGALPAPGTCKKVKHCFDNSVTFLLRCTGHISNSYDEETGAINGGDSLPHNDPSIGFQIDLSASVRSVKLYHISWVNNATYSYDELTACAQIWYLKD